MKLVLDTNVVVSGLLWSGAPAQLLDAAFADEIELFTSRRLLAELARILGRSKFEKFIAATGLAIDDLVLGYADLTMIVDPLPIPPTVKADPDDDHVLACAAAAKVGLIVSGDIHLRDLKSYGQIPIVTPSEALKYLTSV